MNSPYALHSYQQVYYVEADKSLRLNPVAIRPQVFKNKILWEDTSWGAVIKLGEIVDVGKLTKKPPNTIEIKTEKGKSIRLLKLTTEIYENFVKSRVGGKIDFRTDEEIQNYYLNSDFN